MTSQSPLWNLEEAWEIWCLWAWFQGDAERTEMGDGPAETRARMRWHLFTVLMGGRGGSGEVEG